MSKYYFSAKTGEVLKTNQNLPTKYQRLNNKEIEYHLKNPNATKKEFEKKVKGSKVTKTLSSYDINKDVTSETENTEKTEKNAWG